MYFTYNDFRDTVYLFRERKHCDKLIEGGHYEKGLQ